MECRGGCPCIVCEKLGLAGYQVWCDGVAVQKRDFVSRTSTNGNERLLDALIKLRKNEKMKGLKPEQLVSGH